MKIRLSAYNWNPGQGAGCYSIPTTSRWCSSCFDGDHFPIWHLWIILGNCFQVSFWFNPPGGRTYLHNCTWPKMGPISVSSFQFFRNLWSEWSGEVASPQCGYTKASLCQIDRSWPPDLRWYPPKWTTNNKYIEPIFSSSKIHLLFHARDVTSLMLDGNGGKSFSEARCWKLKSCSAGFIHWMSYK